MQVIFNLFKRGISSNCSSLPHRPKYPGENERKKKLRPHDEKNERNLSKLAVDTPAGFLASQC